MKKRSKQGFTLVELLVVIAIIGILASTTLTSLNKARSQARDAQRAFDLAQIRNALTLYYDDHGYYVDDSSCTGFSSLNETWNTSANPLYAALVPTYISKLPVDPLNSTEELGWQNVTDWQSVYTYTYTTCGDPDAYKSDYDLLARVENKNNPNSCQSRGESFCYSHILYEGIYSNYLTDGCFGPEEDCGALFPDH